MDDISAGFILGVVLALGLASAWPNQSVTPEIYSLAASRCEANGGVARVRPRGIVRGAKVWCNNGAEFVPIVREKEAPSR